MKTILQRFFGSSGRPQAKPGKSYRPSRLSVQHLEDRCLMAVTASLSAGILTVNGSIFADTIQLRQVDNQIRVDGVSGQFSVGQIQRIEINAGFANDQILLNSQAIPGQQAITLPSLIFGGPGNDVIDGGAGVDQIFAEGGNDVVWGNIGNDYIDGGSGDDILFGGVGADQLVGDTGNDSLYGGSESDRLVGGDGNDKLYGGPMADFLDGSRGADSLYGEAGYDYIYDDSTGNVISDIDYNRSVGHFGWYDMKIDDAGLRTKSRFLGRDFGLDRGDMLQVFQQLRSDGTVSSGEISDMRDILNGGDFAPVLPDYVRNLTGKVINGDPANAHYQGGSLANLTAGSTSSHLQSLVNKWFLGLDRPAAGSGTYRFVSGLLFQNGPQHTDVRQGGVGDCYFVASLAETAFQSPSILAGMFIDNGDNTFTVRFFKGGVPQFVTVDRYLPTGSNGYSVYASFGARYDNSSNELWVALAEKAYAQLNESGWIGQDGTNSYAGIDIGRPADSMKHITGRSATGYATLNKSQAIAAFQARKLVAFSSKRTDAEIPATLDVVSHHVYALTGYNATTDRFTLYNPWGSSIVLSWTQITQGFRAWHYTNS